MSISTLLSMAQSNINIIIIFIFAGIPLLIGSVAATRSVSTVSDFFLCNRSLGMWASFFTIYATWWSSFAFLGSTASFYARGPLYWIALGWNVLFGLLFMLFGRKIWSEGRKYNYRTPIDFFEDKYHSTALNNIVIILMIGLSIPYISMQFMGGGIVIEMATNSVIPWQVSSLFFFIIMIIYLWSGGLRAVAWTDAFYTILIILGMLFIGIVFIQMTGGVSNTFETIVTNSPERLELPKQIDNINGYGFWCSLLLVMPIGELMMPQIWTRTYAIKEKKTFHIMPFLLSIATLAYLGTMLAGNAAIVLEPANTGQMDYILPTLLIKYLPSTLMSIIVCCAVAACLSTANSQLHSLSQIITLDIYKAHFNTAGTEKLLVFVGKISIILVASIAYLMLLLGNLTTIFDTVLISFCGIMQLIVPVTGGLFWKKSDADSALAGLILGLTITLLFTFWQPFTFPVHPGIIGLFFNALLFIISCHFKAKINNTAFGGFHEK